MSYILQDHIKFVEWVNKGLHRVYWKESYEVVDNVPHLIVKVNALDNITESDYDQFKEYIIECNDRYMLLRYTDDVMTRLYYINFKHEYLPSFPHDRLLNEIKRDNRKQSIQLKEISETDVCNEKVTLKRPYFTNKDIAAHLVYVHSESLVVLMSKYDVSTSESQSIVGYDYIIWYYISSYFSIRYIKKVLFNRLDVKGLSIVKVKSLVNGIIMRVISKDCIKYYLMFCRVMPAIDTVKVINMMYPMIVYYVDKLLDN